MALPFNFSPLTSGQVSSAQHYYHYIRHSRAGLGSFLQLPLSLLPTQSPDSGFRFSEPLAIHKLCCEFLPQGFCRCSSPPLWKQTLKADASQSLSLQGPGSLSCSLPHPPLWLEPSVHPDGKGVALLCLLA